MSTTKIYNLKIPQKIHYPLLVSTPHSGTSYPKNAKTSIRSKYLEHPEDTDWFVDQLYSFALDMGIPTISALYSRYTIDLNRDPQNKSLYSDGRSLTELVPTKSFAGEDLYVSESPSAQEIEWRLKNFYWPYHQKVKALLEELREQFGFSLLIEGHSIKRKVPSICAEEFPDIILGDQEGKTCPSYIMEGVKERLEKSGLVWTYNQPFKGGYLTRSQACPEKNIFSFQIEMSQDVYMDEVHCRWDEEKAASVQKLLFELIVSVSKNLQKTNSEGKIDI